MKKPGVDKNKSMALKLNAKMFCRQFSSFLILDIIVVAILFIGSLVFMENTASTIFKDMKDLKPDMEASENITIPENFRIGNYNVSFYDKKPDSFNINNPIKNIFPENTRSPYRNFSSDSQKTGLLNTLKTIEYHVIIPSDNGYYIDLSINIGIFYYYVFHCLIIVLIIQVILLIETVLSIRKSVNKVLEPLRELSQATQAFSDAASGSAGQYSPEALKNLAQALSSINASHLDTRIPSHLMTEELKPLAAAINEMLNRINESYDSQIRFVSDASHELRTPIAVIQGYAELLSRWGTEDKDTLEESIQAIRTEAESMKQLVNQLLFLARGDKESMILERKLLNLSAIVNDVVKEFDMIDKIHNLRSDISPNIHINGDQGLIKQLLRIIIDNSIKYTVDKGKITIKLTSEDDVRLTIQDEGVGIPADVLPHIFDRFYRADESRARNTGGAGLGLSIGKWIVEKHNGHFEVLSREGIGTRFVIVLPKADITPVPANTSK